MIVDDEEKNIKLLKGMLFSENYQFSEALSGEKALELVHDFGPDLILLDVMMPGINGFEVCQKLKHDEETKSIPIVMVTALSEKVHRLKAMESGADDFVSKPVDSAEVVIRVKSLLRIKSYHDKILNNYEEIASKNKKLLKFSIGSLASQASIAAATSSCTDASSDCATSRSLRILSNSFSERTPLSKSPFCRS